MPIKDLVDYGMGVLALGVMSWVLTETVKRKSPAGAAVGAGIDLAKVVQENTQAVTRLTVLIETQGQMLLRLMEILDDLRFERGRSA